MFDIAGCDEKAIDAVVDEFGDAHDAGGDGGYAGGHGFDDDDGQSFGETRQDEDVGLGEALTDDGLGLVTEKLDVAGEVVRSSEVFEPGPVFAVADEGEFGVGDAADDVHHGFEEDGQALFGDDASGENHFGTGSGMRFGRVQGGIDAHVNDAHAVPGFDGREDAGLAHGELADAQDEQGAFGFFVDAPFSRVVEDGGAVDGEAEGESADFSGKHSDGAARCGEVVVEVGEAASAHASGDEAAFEEVVELLEMGDEAFLARVEGEFQGAEIASRRSKKEACVGADEVEEGIGKQEVGAFSFFALDVGLGGAGIGVADGKGFDVDAEFAQGVDFAVDEVEERDLHVLRGQVSDA